MKLITRYTDYAIRALCFIARQEGEIITVSELVKKVKIPRTLSRKILQILNKERLLKSYKGKGGGFKLNLIPEKIFLLDIIKIFQGPFKLNEHIFKSRLCPNIKECRLKKKLDEIEEYIVASLADITLASLIEKGETNGKEKNNKD